jgi:hypothetical protein
MGQMGLESLYFSFWAHTPGPSGSPVGNFLPPPRSRFPPPLAPVGRVLSPNGDIATPNTVASSQAHAVVQPNMAH